MAFVICCAIALVGGYVAKAKLREREQFALIIWALSVVVPVIVLVKLESRHCDISSCGALGWVAIFGLALSSIASLAGFLLCAFVRFINE
jgi:hypothetical protein